MLTVNTVAQLLKTKDGDVGGILLKNGTIVDTPLGHGEALSAMIQAGDKVRIEGDMNRTGGGRIHVRARKIALPHRRKTHRTVRRDADSIPMVAVGEIEKFMMNRDGNIKGFRLTDGTVVITPPHEGENLLAQLKHGDEVHVTGFQFVTAHGKSRVIAKQIEIQHNRNANERYHESRHPSDDSSRSNAKSDGAKDLDNWNDLNRVANSILSELRVLNRELKTLISS